MAGSPADPAAGYVTPAPAERNRLILATDLPACAKLVLISLAGYLGRGEWVWPCQETIAADTSQHPGQVRKMIRLLEEIGVVHTLSRGKGRQYRLDWQELAARVVDRRAENASGEPPEEANSPSAGRGVPGQAPSAGRGEGR